MSKSKESVRPPRLDERSQRARAMLDVVAASTRRRGGEMSPLMRAAFEAAAEQAMKVGAAPLPQFQPQIQAVSRVSPIDHEMGALDQSVSELELSLEKLEARLKPVIGPAPLAESASNTAAPPEPMRSPIAAGVRNIANRITAARQQLNAILESVET